MRLYPVFLPQQGCPQRCRFCNQHQTGGAPAPVRPDGLDRFLDAMLPASGDGEVAFYGGSFTLLPEQRQRDCLQVARRHIRAGRVAGIRISTRPDALASSQVACLRAQGVTTVEIGCQSFCDRVLAQAHRGYGGVAIAPAVRRIKDAHLRVGLQLMPGLPGGDRREALDSLRQALDLKPDFLRIYPAVVPAGTELAADFAAGRFLPWTLAQTVEVCADMLLACRRAGVPVVRLGLQHTAALEQGAIVAGPHHPALGQLVRSRLWRRALAEVLGQRPAPSAVTVHPADLADAIGHRRDNVAFLEERFPGLRIVPGPNLEREELALNGQTYSWRHLFKESMKETA